MQWIRSKAREWNPPEDATPERMGGIGLNLGCGDDIKEGWVNVDPYASGVDEHWNLLDIPWPYESGSVKHILCDQVLEHLPPRVRLSDGEETHDSVVAVLSEMSRVLRPSSQALVGVPYANSYEDLQNPTHYRKFRPSTLDFLESGTRLDPAAEGLRIPLDVQERRVVRYWTNLLGFVNTAYQGDKRDIPVPNMGPPQQIMFVLQRRREGEAPELSTTYP